MSVIQSRDATGERSAALNLGTSLANTGTIVGTIPIQIDYSDYRDVAGVKMPYRWTITWTDGRSTYEVSDLQTNIAIDAARFGKPAVPAPSAAKAQ